MSAPALQLDIGVVRKVGLARAFFALAQSAARSSNDFNLYVATNHMQDGAEIFLFAVAEHLGVSLKERDGFDRYFDQINAKTGRELPFRARLNALNKTRVSSKHYGVQPERKEVQAFLTVVSEFLEEVCRDLLGVELAQISICHLISNEKIRQALSDANEAFAKGRFADVLIEVRKAFYLEFESKYDISSFVGQKEYEPWKGWFCSAPTYAQDADYIEKNVKEPTDFIVLDHSRIDADLSKTGISHTTFWNVWRLTPEIFLPNDSDEWVVKHDCRVFDEDGIRERAEYVINATTELCISAQRNREAVLSGSYRSWTIRLRKGEVPLYSKADARSSSQPLPLEVEELSASSWITGFDGNIYWNVTLREPLMFGFVSNDDVLSS
jgi:hypothetical protein